MWWCVCVCVVCRFREIDRQPSVCVACACARACNDRKIHNRLYAFLCVSAFSQFDGSRTNGFFGIEMNCRLNIDRSGARCASENGTAFVCL